jgi:hypothetical protein
LEELEGDSGYEETPSTIYCRKTYFLPFREKLAKKGLCGGCHFEFFRFLEKKWQKRVKPTVNSRGEFFFKEFTFIKLY